ncbi:hypothetical protein CAAN3_14S01882 [[Candida] anglica]
MANDVKVEIDRRATGGTFTNHDTIRGNIVLNVTSSISLNSISVKLEGISKTQLHIPRDQLAENRNRSERDLQRERTKKEKTISDVHKVLYDTTVVFPPKNIRDVSSSKEYTLAPGSYTYPFEFVIPLENSCIKLSGISNKIQFNRKTFDISINNGNFNVNSVRKAAVSFLDGSAGTHDYHDEQLKGEYHITSQLPPSFSGLGEYANIRYFIKVTAKRSSILKPNLRSFDPFIFLPLDIDSRGNPLSQSDHHGHPKNSFDSQEIYIRKEMIFSNRSPGTVPVNVPHNGKKLPNEPSSSSSSSGRKSGGGFLSKLFGSPTPYLDSNSPYLPGKKSIQGVPFSFEVRFRNPPFLIPNKPPSFKLYLISSVDPSTYSLAKHGRPDESNGLGVIYMEKLVVDLTSSTVVSVLETDGSYKELHRSSVETKTPICDLSYNNLKLDLMNSKKKTPTSPVYELEIPAKFYAKCSLPDSISPSFTTCNISRRYSLTIRGGFSSQKIVNFSNLDEVQQKIKFVELQCQDVKVLSGLSHTMGPQVQVSPPIPNEITPPRISAPRPEAGPLPSKGNEAHTPRYEEEEGGRTEESPGPEYPSRPIGSSQLPTYEEVLQESTSNDPQAGRRRYQQPRSYYTNLED